jgi:pyrroloquinoline quinone biosynthesis protein E
VTLGADRLEVAHVQYYGWALANRAALLPSRLRLDTVTSKVEAARIRIVGRLVIDYIAPDYYAHRPKACMGGWGRRCLNVSPAGKVLPCHPAETLFGLGFPTVRRRASRISGTAPPPSSKFRWTTGMPAALPLLRPP